MRPFIVFSCDVKIAPIKYAKYSMSPIPQQLG